MSKEIGKKELLGGKRLLLFTLSGSFFIACLLLDGAFAIKRAEAAFTINVPYQQAVPDFLEAITEATGNVKDEGELENVALWEEEVQERLPEFLEDLIKIAQQLEENGNEEFIIGEYQAFADKWNVVSQAYPGLSELQLVLGPIIDKLLDGLPILQSTPPENPVGNFLELYAEMTQINPWFVGSFWDIPLAENTQKRLMLTEKTREITVKGYKSIVILERDTVVQLNGDVVFSELIKNGILTSRSVLLRDPSVLHETLAKMIKDGGIDQEIAIVQELVNLADLNLELALRKGIIDDCSYSFIYRKQLNGTKNTCIDIFGNEKNFIEITKFDPFDHVNQVELTHVDPLAAVTISPAYAANATLTNKLSELTFAETLTELGASSVNVPINFADPSTIIANEPATPINPPLEAWLLGILTPAYLWSAAGLIRMF